MAETPPIVSDRPVNPSSAQPIDDNKGCLASPALSDRTVVPPAAFPSSQEPKSEPMVNSGQALFSNDLGCRPPRQIHPPYPPVIARSDGMAGVADRAIHLFKKYRSAYLCYFPGCGYTIKDLFDEHDIHIDSPKFCNEVLTFITRHNVHLARQFALKWSEDNRERLNVVAEGNKAPGTNNALEYLLTMLQ